MTKTNRKKSQKPINRKTSRKTWQGTALIAGVRCQLDSFWQQPSQHNLGILLPPMWYVRVCWPSLPGPPVNKPVTVFAYTNTGRLFGGSACVEGYNGDMLTAYGIGMDSLNAVPFISEKPEDLKRFQSWIARLKT